MKRTHLVDLYRDLEPEQSDDVAFVAPDPAPARYAVVATNVPCNLQPTRGADAEMMAAGVEPRETWRGYFPRGIAIGRPMAVVVKAGPGPQYYSVRAVRPRTGRFDTETDLDVEPGPIP